MAQITITEHARRRMKRREVSEELVFETVRAPDQLARGYGGRKIAQRRYRREGKERLLRVVMEEKVDEIRVVTVYMTSNISKYWEDGNNEN